MASSEKCLPCWGPGNEDAQTLVHISLNHPWGGFNNCCYVLLCILYTCNNFQKKQCYESSNVFKLLKDQRYGAWCVFSMTLTFNLDKMIFQIRVDAPVK